jgi:hypothetical protein
LTKASQENMIKSLHLAFGESGVQIALVHVEGTVTPENKVLNPKTIAERTYEFWNRKDRSVGLHITEN